MLRLANNPRLMGKHINSRVANFAGWMTALVLIVATAILLASTLIPAR
jgi:Mn2+/Fe2+ NRAMP family transporter